MKHIQAVRAFNRIWGPISHKLQAEKDCSDPRFEKRIQYEYYSCLGRVGVRFGLNIYQLEQACCFQAQHEGHMHYRATGTEPDGP